MEVNLAERCFLQNLAAGLVEEKVLQMEEAFVFLVEKASEIST
jgi:hypothetical protein